MQFTSVIAAAILAYTASALPNSFITSTTTATPAATTTAADAATTTLSLTQQLFIADTAVDRFALIPNDKDFVFPFNDPTKLGIGGKGGDLVTANRKTFPALVGTGSGMAVGFLGPCGFNTPHVHNRATELQIVTQGRLMTEMVPENNVFRDNIAAKGRRVIANEVKTFEMQPFYQGSIHTQFNPDCTNATFIASFNSEDFGAGQVADELFSLSDDVIQASFGQAIDGAEIEKFRKAIPTTIALGVEQCLKQCHIAKR
ncbi:related to spherulin 1A precursor [Phialocephala subalpina]|jgi:hypothetical protein|uniref:Related to spherulin 1A n=1 Tax=Phialocephala subalpina TaxID=576137 RepID=A0A1L7X259_9HELO|nr:related to spherulin 1A precursor [Phialocephala subalpina]